MPIHQTNLRRTCNSIRNLSVISDSRSLCAVIKTTVMDGLRVVYSSDGQLTKNKKLSYRLETGRQQRISL